MKISLTKKALFLLVLLTAFVLGGVIIITQKKSSSPKPTTQNVTPPTPTLTPIISEKYDVTSPDNVAQLNSGTIFLTVTEPKDKATVNSSSVTIKGKTTAGATVFINDKEVRADNGGNFSARATLEEGENTVVIVANDADGNYIEKEIMITLESRM